MFKADLRVHQPAMFTFYYPVIFDKEPKVGSIFLYFIDRCNNTLNTLIKI